MQRSDAHVADFTPCIPILYAARTGLRDLAVAVLSAFACAEGWEQRPPAAWLTRSVHFELAPPCCHAHPCLLQVTFTDVPRVIPLLSRQDEELNV